MFFMYTTCLHDRYFILCMHRSSYIFKMLTLTHPMREFGQFNFVARVILNALNYNYMNNLFKVLKNSIPKKSPVYQITLSKRYNFSVYYKCMRCPNRQWSSVHYRRYKDIVHAPVPYSFYHINSLLYGDIQNQQTHSHTALR